VQKVSTRVRTFGNGPPGPKKGEEKEKMRRVQKEKNIHILNVSLLSKVTRRQEERGQNTYWGGGCDRSVTGGQGLSDSIEEEREGANRKFKKKNEVSARGGHSQVAVKGLKKRRRAKGIQKRQKTN